MLGWFAVIRDKYINVKTESNQSKSLTCLFKLSSNFLINWYQIGVNFLIIVIAFTLKILLEGSGMCIQGFALRMKQE